MKIAFCFLAEGELSRYVLGEITREEVNRNLRKRISDPVLFYKNWIEPYAMDGFLEKRGRLLDMLREMIDSLQSMLDEHASLFAEVNRLLKTSGDDILSRKERDDVIRLTGDLKNFKQEITSAADLRDRVPRWTELYGERSALVAVEVMFALHREKNRLRKASDAIDFAHALFLPHVDLWRGDRAFSDLLKKHRVTCWERVVPALSQLPARIDAGLTALDRSGVP